MRTLSWLCIGLILLSTIALFGSDNPCPDGPNPTPNPRPNGPHPGIHALVLVDVTAFGGAGGFSLPLLS